MLNLNKSSQTLTLVLVFTCFFTPTSLASDNDYSKKIDQLFKSLEKTQKQLIDQQNKLDKQKDEINRLKEELSKVTGNKKIKNTTSTKKIEIKKDASKNPVQQVGLERRPIPKDKPPKIAAVPKEGGVLLPPGSLVIEPSIDYSRSSTLRVAVEGFTIIPALSVGSFEISEVDRDTVTAALSARLGVYDRFELAMRVPYIYRDDSTFSRPLGVESTASLLTSVDGNNIGDIEVSGHYQINDGKNGWPFLIGNLRFKSRTGKDPFEVPLDPITGLQQELSTGSGFYALQPSLTAIYPTDPAVLYGTLGYMFNLERDIGGTFGTIDPGDSTSLGLGMGFALNEKTSFSLGYGHDMVFETKQNGATIPTSDILQIGQLTTGLSHKINDKVNVNFNLSAGLTNDAPDMRVGVKVPIRFNLW